MRITRLSRECIFCILKISRGYRDPDFIEKDILPLGELIKLKINVNLKDHSGYTPLYIALKQEYQEIIEYLKKHKRIVLIILVIYGIV